VLETLADQQPDDLTNLAAVAAAQVCLGDLDAGAGWLLQARARYRRAVSIGESLVAADPADPALRRSLEEHRARLADLEAHARRRDAPDTDTDTGGLQP
jgi:hypothetical protein